MRAQPGLAWPLRPRRPEPRRRHHLRVAFSRMSSRCIGTYSLPPGPSTSPCGCTHPVWEDRAGMDPAPPQGSREPPSATKWPSNRAAWRPRARGPSTARETFSWAPPRAHTESSRRNALPVECTSLVIRPTMHGRTSLFSPPTMWSTRQHSLDGSATCASSVSEPTWPARAASSPIKRRWMSSAPWSTRSPPPHRQAILAIGRQDVDPDGLAPSAAAQLTPATSAQPAGAHTSSSMPSTSRKKSDHSPPSCWISPISASAARRRSLTNSSVAKSATAIPK